MFYTKKFVKNIKDELKKVYFLSSLKVSGTGEQQKMTTTEFQRVQGP